MNGNPYEAPRDYSAPSSDHGKVDDLSFAELIALGILVVALMIVVPIVGIAIVYWLF